MIDLSSWAKRWNDASLRQVASLRQPPPPRRWPLARSFAVGLAAGAIGYYAVTQRSQIKRFVTRALNGTDEALDVSGELEVANPISITSHRSNHRRKADAEVTQS